MSGAIWEDHGPNAIMNDGVNTNGQIDLSANDPIPEAREEFRLRADVIKKQLMQLLDAVMNKGDAPEDPDMLYEKIAGVCLDVGGLAAEISNETERDLFTVCDLLTISLGTTFAAEFPDCACPGDVPYLAEAFARAAGEAV